MDAETFEVRLEHFGAVLTERLRTRLCAGSSAAGRHLEAAMAYSLLGGGKRIRPFLLATVGVGFGIEDATSLLDAGCALEMVHTYSLIHDDLPAMDDSPLRRGRPSVHIKFDEATAILAGDALLTEAFGLLSSLRSFSAARRLKIIGLLAQAAGSAGMCGGQMMDLLAADGALFVDLPCLRQLQGLKTGALLKAPFMMGGVLGGAPMKTLKQLAALGTAVGVLFQMKDDLLDAFGNAATLGKPTGQDQKGRKITYLSFFTPKAVEALLEETAQQALDLLEALCLRSGPKEDLKNLVRYLAHRRT